MLNKSLMHIVFFQTLFADLSAFHHRWTIRLSLLLPWPHLCSYGHHLNGRALLNSNTFLNWASNAASDHLWLCTTKGLFYSTTLDGVTSFPLVKPKWIFLRGICLQSTLRDLQARTWIQKLDALDTKWCSGESFIHSVVSPVYCGDNQCFGQAEESTHWGTLILDWEPPPSYPTQILANHTHRHTYFHKLYHTQFLVTYTSTLVFTNPKLL